VPGDSSVFYGPDFPVARPIPKEIRGPDSSPATNLVVPILKDEAVGNDIVEAVGLFLASDARLNVWYGEGAGKVKPSGMELAEIRVFYAEILHGVYDAWKVFESREGPAPDAAYHHLLSALRSAVSEICGRMGETLADFGTL
jgi:hypothetical protein